MTEQLHFIADAALIDRLGRELVGRQETALVELIKNSYDADATHVTVTLELDALVIDDNGTGMNREDLVAGFLRLASNLKVQEPQSKRYKRHRAGRKGIGRFATQRLGATLRLQTWTDERSAGLELIVDWSLFASGQRLETIPVDLREIPARHTGTIIRIERLRDDWTDAQVRRCWRAVLNLQQPFPVAPVQSRPEYDPGFSVEFWRAGGVFSDETLIANLQTEVLDHSHAIVELRVDDKGHAEWRLLQNQFGADRAWTRIHHEHRDDLNPPAYAALRNVWMRAHYFILDTKLLPSLVYTRLRDIMAEEGGIRLYRNGFRVVPYGDPGNDWLRLDEAYGKRSVLVPIANRNFFGVVEVRDPEGTMFEEHTSREGLIETPAITELEDLANSVLITAVIRISEDRGRKTRAGRPTTPTPESALEKIRAAERRARDAAAAPEVITQLGALTAQETAAILKTSGDALESAKAELADEAAMLRLLATLGLTAAEFSHETGMTFEAVRIDFRRVFEVALEARANDPNFVEHAERARAMLERLDALTAYLNELASARSVREMAPVSVSSVVEKFQHGVRHLAAKSEIELTITTPPLDALLTRPMHRAEVASILLNFYSNSVKAMRRTTSVRKILVDASREGQNTIVIRFSDTGDGIDPAVWDKVFDLFFTTRAAASASASHSEQVTGTGLGLWIVHQIASKAGGDVVVADPPTGYSTCFELRLPAGEESP